MSARHRPAGREFFKRWVGATFAGWLLGFVFIVLAAAGGDLIGVGDGESQFIVGIAMGAGVGYAQGRVMRRRLDVTWGWVWASAIGLGVPVGAFDIATAVWGESWPSIPIAVVTGGLLAGLLQRRILRSRCARADWWVPACVAGWTSATGTAAVSGLLPSGPSAGWFALVNIAVILLGGVVLGIVTGGALVWMLRD
ncbi:MAG: hypothetical protein D6718_09615 [Acidobacteria bacterium]|nr:MAG: hypothetical protein D6718_09615 [Acidobacteriota bacterium]